MDILEKIMGVDEASELWGLSAGYIKNLCASQKIECKKIGKTWVIAKEQPNPKTIELPSRNPLPYDIEYSVLTATNDRPLARVTRIESEFAIVPHRIE